MAEARHAGATTWSVFTAMQPATRRLAPNTWRTRATDGISLGMHTIFAIGVALWLVYGLLIRACSVVAGNSITMVLASFILVLKLRHG